jgi:hypothetical protein
MDLTAMAPRWFSHVCHEQLLTPDEKMIALAIGAHIIWKHGDVLLNVRRVAVNLDRDVGIVEDVVYVLVKLQYLEKLGEKDGRPLYRPTLPGNQPQEEWCQQSSQGFPSPGQN